MQLESTIVPLDRRRFIEKEERVTWGEAKTALFDRDEQKQRLRDRFWDVTNGTLQELVLITGPSGTGKTVLAQTLESLDCFFCCGKFDQIVDSPLMPFADILASWKQQAFERLSEEELKSLREVVLQTSAGEVGILVQFLPELADWLSAEISVPVPAPAEAASTRFFLVICNFIRCISSVHPVVLFLDDLQWASTESLRLLSAVLTTGNITGLFVLGACRSDEVSADDDLSRTLRKLENDEKVKLTEIRVQNLDEDTVAALVAQRTLLPTGQSDYLSGFIYKYTKGNPVYTVQMLQALQDTGWRTMQNSKNVLAFGLKGLGSDNMDTLENFIRWRLQSLDGDMREVLTTAACMGNEFDAHWINMAVKYPTEDLLNKAVLLQWLVHVSNATPRYRFIHDKVQQAAYALIDDQPAFHLQIGRRIWKSVDHVEGNAIMILNQLRLATHLLTTEQDRVAVAELCLVAGKDAERISSFNEASSHFALGRSLLPRRPWRDCYHLALDLFSSGAEVEYAIGNFETIDILVDAILNNARSPQDQLPAYTIHIYSLGSRSRLQDALKTGLLVLEKLKVPLPRKAGPLRIQYELRKTQRLLKNVSDDAILGLPGMTDENKLSAMQIMNIMFTYAFSISPRHSLMIALRLTQLSLADGVSALSATGFAFYSMMLCIALGQPNDGFRYGQVALRLLDRFNSHEWMPRVYCVVYGMVNTNKLTTRQSIAPLSKAHKIGLASGDTEFSMMSLHLCTCCQFYSAEPLPYQFVDYKYYRQLMLTFKQNNILQLHNVFLQTVANLLGEGEGDPFNLTGEFLVEAEVLAECKEQNNMTLSQSIFTFKLMIAYLLNRYEDAVVRPKTKVKGS